ncbi:flagellar protein FlgN [Paenibacillus yanchengensis]|uniref:Flagellar protein FlgN n=1 Tax=Paenibacillus yanchengensis TaxID=2035833 RepID=A0ABW4YNB6_9BACL
MSFRELADTLISMKHMYESLYDIAMQKQQAIKSNEITALTTFVAQETKLVKTLEEHEASFKAVAITFQRDKGLRPKLKINLSDLVKVVSHPEEKQELIQLQQQIEDITRRLQAENELNQLLIQQSLDFVNVTLDAVLGADEEEYTYKKPTMHVETNKRRGIIDHKA